MLVQSCCFAFEIFFFLTFSLRWRRWILKSLLILTRSRGALGIIRKRNFLPSRRSSRSLWPRFPRSVLRETTEDELLFCLQWWKMMSNERRPNTWKFIPPANQTSSMFPLMTIRTGNLPLYSIKSRVNNCIARWGLSEWKGLKKHLFLACSCTCSLGKPLSFTFCFLLTRHS